MGEQTKPKENEGCCEIQKKIIFGRYEIGRLLGKGTFAKVYYGKHLQSGEGVAIKILDKDQIRRERLVDQLVREISVMKLVRHPNVVELREVMATKSRVFFVMEYVRGGELFSKVARGKLREDVARRYFQQLISAVDFCHSRGISHRDLKLENVLLDHNGDIKVSDFGLSALPEQLRNDGLLHTQCGTPAYVAPEVLRRKGYDGAKADLWSCGVVLYVLLAGFLPFQEENLMKLYSKVFKADFKMPPWFSAGAQNLITRLLVTDPEKRITVAEIMENPWFRKGYSAPVIEELRFNDPEDDDVVAPPAMKGTPAFYNAFELISAMSSGFDLSGIFENRRRVGTAFTSRRSAGDIVEVLEKVGKGLGFKTVRSKEYKVRFEGKNCGRKGRLGVTAEVFEMVPEVAVVEFLKTAGDYLDYAKFCEQEVRPGLKDIVWKWQGDDDVRSDGRE